MKKAPALGGEALGSVGSVGCYLAQQSALVTPLAAPVTPRVPVLVSVRVPHLSPLCGPGVLGTARRVNAFAVLLATKPMV